MCLLHHHKHAPRHTAVERISYQALDKLTLHLPCQIAYKDMRKVFFYFFFTLRNMSEAAKQTQHGKFILDVRNHVNVWHTKVFCSCF